MFPDYLLINLLYFYITFHYLDEKLIYFLYISVLLYFLINFFLLSYNISFEGSHLWETAQASGNLIWKRFCWFTFLSFCQTNVKIIFAEDRSKYGKWQWHLNIQEYWGEGSLLTRLFVYYFSFVKIPRGHKNAIVKH